MGPIQTGQPEPGALPAIAADMRHAYALAVVSPVPPADGVVTDERLSLLLALRTEYDDLDFKCLVDLSTTPGAVELAKDVEAMQVKGGWIVSGVDGHGEPAGDMDGMDTSPFDVANLVPKMQRYLYGSLDLVTNVLARDGHTIVLICVKPNPRGCAFFRIDGEYERDDGETVTRFRAGEVFWRDSTRSVRITMDGLEEIIERRFAARRDDLLREWTAAQRALGASTERGYENTAAAFPPAPELSFALTPDQVPEIALRLMRADDDVGVRHLLDDGRRRARIYIEDDELAEDQLPLLLDSIICLAASFLNYEREDWFERVVQLLVDSYATAGDKSVVERLGFSTRISPQEKAPRVWLAIIERVFALGGLAVRKEAWKAVRALTVQLPGPLAEFGFDANWLRHALTMASRAAGFAPASSAPGSAPASGGEPQLSLIDLARDDAARLECLRPDGANDEALLTSIAQFDVLSNIAAIDHAQSTETKVFYPSFARFRQDRIQPAVDRLLTDPEMREEIFHGDDTELATALATVGWQASREGMLYNGFRAWTGTAAGQFVLQNLPRE